MRILHTADWHAGKSLYGISRDEELGNVLNQISDYISNNSVDLVIVAGDIFDTYSPSATAEEVVYDFFSDLHKQGVQAIIIPGNHDSRERFKSHSKILSLANVNVIDKAVDKDKKAKIIDVKNSKGEVAHILGLPFVAERSLASLERTLIEKDKKKNLEIDDKKIKFSEKLTNIINHLVNQMPKDGIKIFVAHQMIEGAKLQTITDKSGKKRFTGTERVATISEHYALPQQFIPEDSLVHYVALGHIHKYQKIENSPVPAYYCGSPMHLDFGETNDDKGFIVVDVIENTPPKVEFKKVEMKKPLKVVSCKIEELDEKINEYSNFNGYLKFVVETKEGRSTLRRDLKNNPLLVGKLLEVEIKISDGYNIIPKESEKINIDIMDPIKSYEAYCKIEGKELSQDILNAFKDLYEKAQAEELK